MNSKIEILEEFFVTRKNGKKDRRVRYKCPICHETKESNPWNVKKTTCCKTCRNKISGVKKRGGDSSNKGIKRPHTRRENSARWNGGRFINSQGYVMVLVKSGSINRKSGWENYKPEHVVKIEELIGRKLIKGECVHHIDGDRTNNDLDNLVLLSSHQEHRLIHAKFNQLLYKLYQQKKIGFNRQTLEYFIIV